MEKINQKSVFSNLIWRFLERSGAQIVTFVVSIILARLLDPAVYGTIALVMVFTTILQVFVDSGFGTALIQKKDSDDLDFSTVFYFNIVLCVVLYGAMFLLAPLIANFYKHPELTPVIRVLSIVVLISGVKGIQIAYVSKHLMFRKFFWATLIGTVTAAGVGVFMAYKGYGIWALVVQNIVNQAIDTIILWIVVKWRPKWMFSFKRLKRLFSYGWKLLVSALLDTIYNEAQALIIGRKYSTEDLAYYNKGRQFPQVIVTNINTSIDSVLLPTLSSEQENKERVKQMTKRAITVSCFVMMPLMVGLSVCAESFVHVLLTDKWLPCVFFLRIFCVTFAFYPVHTANLNAMKAMGRSDYFLILEIIKKGIGMTVLLITMWISVEAMAWSLLFTTVTSLIINSWPNRKLLGYGILEQIKDILPSILLAAFMGAVVYYIGFTNGMGLWTLIKQVVVGFSIYTLLAVIFKMSPYIYIRNLLVSFVKGRKHE